MSFDINNATQRDALRAELQTDPRGYGFGPLIDPAIGNDTEVARLLNLPRDGSPDRIPTNPTAVGGTADGKILVDRGYIFPQELANAIVYAEYTGGQAAPRQYIDMIMSLPQIDVSPNSNPRLGLLAIFAAGSQTRTNIGNVAKKVGSRAEELFGSGTNISSDQVGKVLRG